MASKPSLLFRIYRVNPEHCHYILGTMHIDNEDAYTHVELAKKYIDVTSMYYAEMDLSGNGEHDLMKYFTLQDGTKLQHLFKTSHYIKMKKTILKTFGIDLDLMNNFIPFYIQTILSEIVLNHRNGQALDYFLWIYAKNNNKVLGGVETVEDQLGILKSIPLEFQVKSLLTICRNTKKFKYLIHSMSSAYKDCNLKKIYQMSKKQLGPLRKMMLIDRNHKMIQSIVEKSNLEPSFFAVGAAHLYGSSGILHGLKINGFKVVPVYN